MAREPRDRGGTKVWKRRIIIIGLTTASCRLRMETLDAKRRLVDSISSHMGDRLEPEYGRSHLLAWGH